MNARTYKWHPVTPADQKRITCGSCYAAPATKCLHVDWNTGNTTGLSFWYYCDPCFDETIARERQYSNVALEKV